MTDKKDSKGAGIRFVLDIAPLAVFFIVYQLEGLQMATAALIPATLLALGIGYYKEKKISPMPAITGVAVLVLGGLTLWLDNELFIKMKPTMVNAVFGTVVLASVALGRPILKFLFSMAFHLTDRGWRLLSLRWGVFFFFLAGLNEYIWRNYSTDFWVDFKVFGMLSLTIVFTLAQLPLLMKEMLENDNVNPPPPDV